MTKNIHMEFGECAIIFVTSVYFTLPVRDMQGRNHEINRQNNIGIIFCGSVSACTSEQSKGLKVLWDKWYFAFTTPKALPAQVTLLKLLDVDGYASTYWTIDQLQGISVGKWSERNSAGNTQFNKADRLPQIMIFCWDSIIDKKYISPLYFSLQKHGIR
ncbi:DUF2931 family protein [Escherichia marmotae]|nr:DUF2931 family protein [Escherichia marmotae]MED0428231.1 DUF2931 family protein [Escherichia marmotae]